MKKATLKKLACCICAAATSSVALATFASCETSYPKAEIVVSFNDVDYTLNYELARKLAPATVRHFIELADNGFYDGVCIHDYSATKWITGGYKMQGDELEEIDYFNVVSSYGLTQSVWLLPDKQSPTDTVYGEFTKNSYKVSSGAWKQTYGSLSMFYTDKTTDEEVYVDRFDGEGQSYKSYKYNSATSLFYFYVSSSQTSSDNYCTFGKLVDKSKDTFDSLVSAISDYAEDTYGDEGFTTSEKLSANKGDLLETNTTVTANVPKKPIIVKSVNIKKY